MNSLRALLNSSPFTTLAVCIGILVNTTSALAGTFEASTATIEPVIAEPAPLLEAPPALTNEQRAIVEEATQRSHIEVPIPNGDGAKAVSPTSPPSQVGHAPKPAETTDRASGAVPASRDPNDFVIFQDNLYSPPSGYSSTTNEPSVAQADNVVFYTGNWYAGVSTDHGQTIGFIDPFSGPFAPVNNGFCCDQVTIYDPSRDAIFYLQQYIEDGTTGTQRINVDTGADGVFDCAYDFTPQGFGRPTGEWLDFPDLVLGENSLYHTSNMFTTSTDSFTGSVIARYPLDDMANCQSMSFNIAVFTDRGSLRATHGAGTTMYWGTHNSKSSVRIYSWDEGSTSISSTDQTVTTWFGDRFDSVCPGPDGNDFTYFSDGRIQGSWVANGVIGFLWNSAQHGGFPFPYVRGARFDETTKSLIDEPAVWSYSYCWAYPSVGVNASGELGGTILAGSASTPMQCQAWIADAVNGGSITGLENMTVAIGSAGPASNRSGDYLTTRGHKNYFENTWAGTCFTYPNPSTGYADPRFVWFGREQNARGTHACCNTGDAGCIDFAIEAAVCAADNYCCNYYWDEICVAEVTSVYGDNCDACLVSTDAEGSYDFDLGNTISDCVCSVDPFCCQVTWDSICVDEVESLSCGSCATCSDHLILSSMTISTSEQFEACDSITVGPAVAVASPAQVELLAGQRISFGTDVAFEQGTTLSAQIGLPACCTPGAAAPLMQRAFSAETLGAERSLVR